MSCSKDDNNSISSNKNPIGSITEGIEAKVDTHTWKAFNYEATVCGKQIYISGLDSALGQITITINDTILGTYDLNTTSNHWATYSPKNSSDIYTTFSNPNDGGILNLSMFDKDTLIISGSFIFYVYSPQSKKTITISSGAFANINLKKENYPTTGFRAYIGNKLWTSTMTWGIITNDSIQITGSNSQGEQITFKICNRLKNSYLINAQSCHYARYITSTTDNSPYLSNSSSLMNGKFIIENISTDSIIQGSFIVSVYRPSDKKTIHITRGLYNGIKLNQ